jgi:hypothetical protein
MLQNISATQKLLLASALKKLLAYFLALHFFKGFGLLHERCPFFSITCLLPPSLQFQLSQIIRYKLFQAEEYNSFSL